MYRLIITLDVQNEIGLLANTDMDAAAAATILLEELAVDQNTLEYLCVPNNYFQYTPSFEIKKFVEAQKRGYNIFILKFLDEDGHLPNVRILIGFNAQRSVYYALAIPPRNVSYLTDQDRFRDLLNRYEQCGIPVYR